MLTTSCLPSAFPVCVCACLGGFKDHLRHQKKDFRHTVKIFFKKKSGSLQTPVSSDCLSFFGLGLGVGDGTRSFV